MGAGYGLESLLDAPFTALEVLIESAGERQRTQYISEIRARRMSNLDNKGFAKAMRQLER